MTCDLIHVFIYIYINQHKQIQCSYKVYARNVVRLVHHASFRNLSRSSSFSKNCLFAKNLKNNNVQQMTSTMQCEVTAENSEHTLFCQEHWGKFNPAQPSPQSTDLNFRICSKSCSHLIVTLLTPSAVSSDTSSLLGLSATLLLVGTRANHTFS